MPADPMLQSARRAHITRRPPPVAHERPPGTTTNSPPAHTINQPGSPNGQGTVLKTTGSLFITQNCRTADVRSITRTTKISGLALCDRFNSGLKLFHRTIQSITRNCLPRRIFTSHDHLKLHHRLRHITRTFITLIADPRSLTTGHVVTTSARLTHRVKPVCFRTKPTHIHHRYTTVLTSLSHHNRLTVASPRHTTRRFLILLGNRFISHTI